MDKRSKYYCCHAKQIIQSLCSSQKVIMDFIGYWPMPNCSDTSKVNAVSLPARVSINMVMVNSHVMRNMDTNIN